MSGNTGVCGNSWTQVRGGLRGLARHGLAPASSTGDGYDRGPDCARIDKSVLPVLAPSVPCGGLRVTDQYWSSSELSKVISTKPDKLFVSMSLDVSNDVATIQIRQDFDCDGVFGVTKMVGRLHKGRPALGGGWERLLVTVPEIDE